MSEREEAMRELGLFACPVWCVQPDDEEQYEEHFGPWVAYENADNEFIVARKRMSWHEGSEDHLELTIRSHNGTINLTLDEMNQMVWDLLYGEESEINNSYEVKPAYEGAEVDAAAAEDDEEEDAD